jgi:hypothetical protein
MFLTQVEGVATNTFVLAKVLHITGFFCGAFSQKISTSFNVWEEQVKKRVSSLF